MQFATLGGKAMAWLKGTEYFWVVLCKNRAVHNKYNLFSRHAILLAEADEISSSPQVGSFTVVCDDCGKEFTYEAKDVLRAELDDRGSFTTHPLFEKSSSNREAQPIVPSSLSDNSTGGTTVLERIRTAIAPYLRFRHKEGPPPRWRR